MANGNFFHYDSRYIYVPKHLDKYQDYDDSDLLRDYIDDIGENIKAKIKK